MLFFIDWRFSEYSPFHIFTRTIDNVPEIPKCCRFSRLLRACGAYSQIRALPSWFHQFHQYPQTCCLLQLPVMVIIVMEMEMMMVKRWFCILCKICRTGMMVTLIDQRPWIFQIRDFMITNWWGVLTTIYRDLHIMKMGKRGQISSISTLHETCQ